MRTWARKLVRHVFSPSTRFELRAAADRLQEQCDRLRLGHWEFVRITGGLGASCDLFYWGRREYRPLALVMLGIDEHVSVVPERLNLSKDVAVIGDVPLPGSLRMPAYLRTIVPLGRPLEEITARYDPELRRRLRKQRPRFRIQQVLDPSEIDRLDQEMLRPYVTERHPDDQQHVPAEEVRRIAHDYGRLDLLYCDDKEVGCHLGHTLIRTGKRYWVTSRFGYPQSVFSEQKRLAEINSMNTYMALEFATEQGYDYYDIGQSLGRPDDGLLQWKRRRAGALDTMLNYNFLHFRLPRQGRAQLLWDTPLFSVQREGLTLWLGLPESRSDEEAANRYRQMGFGGLSRVRVQSARPPSSQFVDHLRGRFANHPALPAMETVLAD